MISAHAKDSIERIFLKAAQSRLTMAGGRLCEIVPVGARSARSMPDAKLVVLTISGLRFRLLLILHFDEDERTREYFAKRGVGARFLEDLSGNLQSVLWRGESGTA